MKKAFEQMDDKFYQDDFEHFLQAQANDHRMFPSDAVWRNIHKQLHGDSKWPALTVAAFALLITTVAVCVYFRPNRDIFAVPATATVHSMQLSKSNSNLASPAILSVNANNNNVLVVNANWKPQNAVPVTIAEVSTDVDEQPLLVADVNTKANLHTNNVTDDPADNQEASDSAPFASTEVSDLSIAGDFSSSTVLNASQKLPSAAIQKAVSDPAMDNQDSRVNKPDVLLKNAVKEQKPNAHKWSYNVYITPSISYRKLIEDRSHLQDNAGGPVAINYVADVHQIVRHKPGNGMEAGFGILYSLSPNVRVRGGVQFNFRQYSIEAYNAPTEMTSIALIRQQRVDTVKSISKYRTMNGNSEAEISNRYYQLSVPVGIDWQLIGNRAIQLNVAATLQPTYQVNRDAYILSASLTNYTESPDMQKSWNLNTSLEAYLSFKMGDYRWQVGPQLRYQNLPTLIKAYPIKEHLLDYGIKFGVTKPLN